MNATDLGRLMMIKSGDIKDDTKCCEWARVGQILTQLGTPRMPASYMQMNTRDQAVVLDALKSLQIKQQDS
jgi:hypothetical protein